MKNVLKTLNAYYAVVIAISGMAITVIWWIGRVDAAVMKMDGFEDRTFKIERKLDYLMYKMGYPYREN